MPLVAHSQLPSFEKLRENGHEVLSLDYALKQDIRELHIGLLNMMPDSALQVTEQQYMRLVGSSNKIAQFYVHPFTIPGLNRSADKQAHIEKYYRSFEEIRTEGLDALIITGANVANPSLEQEPFWEPLTEVMEWASQNVPSVLCSCLATHAIMKFFYNIDRQRMPQKKWGVYSHRVTMPSHPLLRDINTRFDVPHSRYNDVSRAQFESAGLAILIESAQAGVHMAVSADQFRVIYLQGHPEYYTNSLLKEYRRDLMLHLQSDAEQPPFPDHYLPEEAQTLIIAYIDAARQALREGVALPPFPEDEIIPLLDNTWNDTGKSIFNNWLGLVYQLTNVDRRKLFMDGIDPQDPLGIR